MGGAAGGEAGAAGSGLEALKVGGERGADWLSAAAVRAHNSFEAATVCIQPGALCIQPGTLRIQHASLRIQPASLRIPGAAP